MRRFIALTFLLWLSASPAIAHDGGDHKAVASIGERAPIAAPKFRKLIEMMLKRMREAVETKVTKLSPENAQEERAKLEAMVKRVNKVLDEVCADGTVTPDEVRRVKQAFKG